MLEDIRYNSDIFKNIDDIRIYSPNSIIAVAKNKRHFKITATEVLRGGQHPVYTAAYEERIPLTIQDISRNIWASTDMPCAVGSNVEECLRSALSFVDEM